MNVLSFLSGLFLLVVPAVLQAQIVVPEPIMQKIYQEVKTPYKYGLVLVPESSEKMVDSPSIFRYGKNWYMTYIIFDGKGYETWLAKSKNLLNWETLGKIMSFTENTWDANQKAGYIALQDYQWGGKYAVGKYARKYWMSYLGGATQGYEAGVLGIGMAFSKKPDKAEEWQTLGHPAISAKDADVRWYDNVTIYKSTVIHDKKKTLGHPFVMYYNAKGSDKTNEKAERIAMAVSDDMMNWKRFGNEPVIDHQTGISGDAFITKVDDVWVMFYFGASWKPGAFDRFACSYDLINWTDWTGDDLISPSEEYDNQYAHKPFVIKYKGIVYHYYCAVDKKGNRGIAVATSVDIGKSKLQFQK
ncbi:MAG TPA: glycosylase [Prolixibacteraceae bacterium]|nr:glycosylase [Prolixibacteraceae bacterium]HCR89852.1 glycosylase [Prolixibacteraceae bacterium]HCU63510.1 glycosylase [Prolixibacteraceae bacterium]